MRAPNSFSVVTVLAGVLAGLALPAQAQTALRTMDAQHDVGVLRQRAGAPLSLGDALTLAVRDQPILVGREDGILAQEQQAIAARQLPDPTLSVGLQDLPIDTGDAFSLRRDNFTQLTVGLTQDFPRRNKRLLQGSRQRIGAERERIALDNDRRVIERDTALAWWDVYEAEQGRALAHRLSAESALQVQSLDAQYRNGRAPQADWFAAKVDAGLALDKEHDWLHRSERARAALGRWIGEAAQRPLGPRASAETPPATLATLLAAIAGHPAIGEMDKNIEAADNDVALARQAYKPDLSVEGYVAYRPAYSDFVGVRVSIDLPYFTARRQGPALASALRQADAAQARKDDGLRALQALVREDYLDWQHDQERVAEFDASMIPDAQRRTESARVAYAGGRGNFDGALLARRSLFDLQLQRLALDVDSARAQARLRYYCNP